MEVTRVRALRGPNLWSKHTSIEALVQCDLSRELDLRQSPNCFEQRLRHLFPSIYSIYTATNLSC